jgi:hypothetical protein
LNPLQDFGELHGEVDALADMLHALFVGFAAAQPLELIEQQLEIVGQEPMAEFGICTRPCRQDRRRSPAQLCPSAARGSSLRFPAK